MPTAAVSSGSKELFDSRGPSRARGNCRVFQQSPCPSRSAPSGNRGTQQAAKQEGEFQLEGSVPKIKVQDGPIDSYRFVLRNLLDHGLQIGVANVELGAFDPFDYAGDLVERLPVSLDPQHFVLELVLGEGSEGMGKEACHIPRGGDRDVASPLPMMVTMPLAISNPVKGWKTKSRKKPLMTMREGRPRDLRSARTLALPARATFPEVMASSVVSMPNSLSVVAEGSACTLGSVKEFEEAHEGMNSLTPALEAALASVG
jgi:hypothetical protein